MAKQSQPKPFKPVVFTGPFTSVTVYESYVEYKHGFPFATKGFIEFDNIGSMDYTAMTNKLRIGSKDGARHEFQLFSGGKCRDLIMQLKQRR